MTDALNKTIKILKYAWASPVTFFGFLYVLSFWALGWYKFNKRVGDALVWHVVDEKAPKWLLKKWDDGHWAGHCIGNVIALRKPVSWKTADTLVHEEQHVEQCMRLGIFQPIMYFLIVITIKVGCKNLDTYHDNVFEIDARKGARQIDDLC